MSRDREASGTAGQDIRHIPAEERENLPGSSAVGLQRYEKNSAAVCRIGDFGQVKKEGLRDGAFSFFIVFRIFLLTHRQSRDIITKLTSDSTQFPKVLQKTSKKPVDRTKQK